MCVCVCVHAHTHTYIYIYIYIYACSVKDHGLFSFQNLHVKTFESCYFSYVWIKMVKKVIHTSPSAFDYFTGRPQGLFKFVCRSEFYLYLFGVLFFIDGLGPFC